jgi:predicted nucleic acid-binding protein
VHRMLLLRWTQRICHQGIDDKNGINACKILGIAFTTAVGILIRSREKGLLEEHEALERLASLAKYGRYKDSIIEDARLKLEAKR